MVVLEFLFNFEDRFKYQHHIIFTFELGFRMKAVIAILTVLVHFLAEIIQQLLWPAYGRFRIGNCLEQQLFSDFLFGNRLALHEFFKLLDILVTIESYAIAFTTVATGASCLLVIAFETFRNIVMDNESYVGLINAHSKCNGSNNHIGFFHQKSVLIL